MSIMNRYHFIIILFLFVMNLAKSYDLSGVSTTFNFGTITSPFPDLTLVDNSICVGYGLLESSSYHVNATSAGAGGVVGAPFQMTNGAYKLSYSVSWAGTAGGSPSYVALSSGVNSSSSFTAQVLGGLTCLLLPANATMQLKLLNADQVLAKQGTYTDTLTVLIVA